MIRGLRVPVHLTSRDALRILDIADIWASRTGREVRLVSANDHVHSRRSAHYEGRALDFHSSDPEGLSMVLRQAGYRVLWNVPGHYSHVHVEETRARDSSLFAIGLSRDAVNKVLKVGLRTRAGVAQANASLPPAWRQQAN